MKNATLIFPIRKNKILLGFKQKKVSKGLWSGYGGKQEQKETIIDSAKREFIEESGTNQKDFGRNDFQLVGCIDFKLKQENQQEFNMKVFVYILDNFQGDTKDNDEMKNHTWFSFEEIPYENMLPDMKIFLPYILQGEFLIGNISTINNKIEEYVLRKVSKKELDDILIKTES